MKRTALIATLALVAVSPAVAHAAPSKGSRTITMDYTGALGVSAQGAGFNSTCSFGVGDCMDFTTVKGEKTITLKAADSAGAVGIQVFIDDDFDTVQLFCGTGSLTVSPKTATPVSVRPAFGECDAQPTSGTITAVITKK